MKGQAEYSYYTSELFMLPCHNIPEDFNLHQYPDENLKSHKGA